MFGDAYPDYQGMSMAEILEMEGVDEDEFELFTSNEYDPTMSDIIEDQALLSLEEHMAEIDEEVAELEIEVEEDEDEDEDEVAEEEAADQAKAWIGHIVEDDSLLEDISNECIKGMDHDNATTYLKDIVSKEAEETMGDSDIKDIVSEILPHIVDSGEVLDLIKDDIINAEVIDDSECLELYDFLSSHLKNKGAFS